MGHSEFREWAEAALGDPRQIYARRADASPEDPLVYMPDDEAARFREAAKSGVLICPVPGCPSPRLNTRACEDRRDHFVHVVAPADKAHKQTYMRMATQHLLRDWAESQSQVTSVADAEMDDVSVALAAFLDNGSKVALCYVDKRLGADSWEEHNAVIRSKGFAAVWIFALEKMYFKPPDPAESVDRDRTDLILDRAIYRRMRQRGSWPLILNVDQEEFANIVKPGGSPARRLHLVPPSLDRVQHVVVQALADCRLCSYGIATPAIPEYTLRATSDNWRS